MGATGYNNLFGGSAVFPSNLTYIQLALAANTQLVWPIESAASEVVIADLMDVTPAAPGNWNLALPDARGGSTGIAMVLNNLSGLYSYNLTDDTGGLVLTAAPGTVWLVYLADNSTQAGVWRSFQYGAQAGSVNLAAIAGSGIFAIGSSLNASMQVSAKSANYTVVNGDRATVVLWTGAGGTVNLPDPTTLGNNWFVYIKNAGSGDISVVAGGAGEIDGASNKTFSAGVGSAIVFTDGVNFYTLGYGGAGSVGGFDYISIDISGTGDFTLTGAQLSRITYHLTGTLTGNRNIIVPATKQQYWVDNETTGAFTVTVKTAAGTGQTVTQGGQAILYSDGTNVQPAQSGVTLPVAVASGGTGASTAATARQNLGSTTVGDAVFTAVSAAAARAQLGSTSVGDALFIAASVNAALNALAGGTMTGTLAVTGAFGAGSFSPTSPTVPVCGIYLQSAGVIGIATNTTLRGRWLSTGGLWISPPDSGAALKAQGVAGASTVWFIAANTASQAFGPRVDAGTNATDYNMYWGNAAGNAEYGRVTGDGNLKWANAAYTAPNAIGNSGASFAINCATSNVQTVTLSANCTMGAPTNPNFGQTLVILITQGASAFTLAFNAVFKWPGGVAPTASTANGAVDMMVATYDGAFWRSTYTNNFS